MAKTLFELTEGSAPLLTDYALTGEDPANTHVLRRLTWQTILNLFTANSTSVADNGWVPRTDIWSYASANTITVPSGAAAIYSVGDKIKLTQTTTKYFYIVAVANTVLTITGGTSYTLADAAIVSPYYSKAASPVGFPSYFGWTGAAGSNPQGFSEFLSDVNPFTINGRLLTINMAIYGTSNATTLSATLPVAAAVASRELFRGRDSGTTYPVSLAMIAASSATIDFYKDVAASGWTNTGTKGVYFATFQYFI